MGWCHEFGVRVNEGCDHPMTAGSDSCQCEECGIVCWGRFASCDVVWAQGPRPVTVANAPGDSFERATKQLPLDEIAEAEPPPPPPPRPFATPVASLYHGAPGGFGEAGDARIEVMAWLRSAFDGLRAELRVLSDNIARQQSAIADVVDAHEAAAGIVQVAESLPGRVATAVSEAVAGLAHERTDEAKAALDGVTEAIVQLEYLADDLRNESVRLHAFREALAADLPAVARAVEEAAARADARLAELTDRVDELAARKGLSGLMRGLGAGGRST